MPRKTSVQIELKPNERMFLGRMQKASSWSFREATRADIVWRAARGQSNYQIAKQLGISRNTVKLWRYRFAKEGMGGLKARPIPGRPKRAGRQDCREKG